MNVSEMLDVMNESPYGIYAVDSDQRIVYWNSADAGLRVRRWSRTPDPARTSGAALGSPVPGDPIYSRQPGHKLPYCSRPHPQRSRKAEGQEQDGCGSGRAAARAALRKRLIWERGRTFPQVIGSDTVGDHPRRRGVLTGRVGADILRLPNDDAEDTRRS